MYKKEIDAIKAASEQADKYGLPFAVIQNHYGEYESTCIENLSVLDTKCAIVLSDGTFQRLDSYVVRNVKED